MSFGRLERTEGPRPMSEINVTPLVDVMLVLVVIFIITAPLLSSALRLELPRSDAGETAQAPAVISIGIDRAGQLYVDDQPVSTEQLAIRLDTASKLDPEAEVQLRADVSVPYGRIVDVMGLAQKAGLHRMGFVARPEK